MKLTVRVTPRSAADVVGALDDAGTLAVRVTAAPADGAANAAVVRLLARALGLPQRDVVLVSGLTSRVKLLEIPLQPEELANRLASPARKP